MTFLAQGDITRAYTTASGRRTSCKPRIALLLERAPEVLYRIALGRLPWLLMISTTAIRSLSIWLVGLFLIAQIFGVVSLLSEHTAHVAATELLASQGSATPGHIPERRHYRGDADGGIQQHELQDLNGTLACLSSRCDVAFVHVANTAYVPSALAENDPVPLERPPKAMPSV